MYLRHRTASTSILAVGLLSLLAPVGLTRVDAHAGTATSDLRIVTSPGPGNPLSVDALDPADPPPSPQECLDERALAYQHLCYEVFGTVLVEEPVADVVVTVVEHDGLYVDPLVTDLGTLEPGGPSGNLFHAVRAETVGLHTLTLEVTASGHEPLQISLPYVWRAGGPPIEGDDSLAGRLYGRTAARSYRCRSHHRCTVRTAERVTFLDGSRAGSALALDGKRTCGPGGCSRYRYDAASGLVQIGDETIGRITSLASYIGGESYARMVYPRPGLRLDGWWAYAAMVDEARGVKWEDLWLRPNGHFRLDYVVDTTRYRPPGEPETGVHYRRHLSGSYEVRRRGRLVLTDPKRGRKVATLALVASPQGTPRPRTLGMWLDLPLDPPKGRPFVDGNLLTFRQ